MISLKIRTLLLVITLLSPTVFSCAKCITENDDNSIILVDLNEDEEEDDVKKVNDSEEYTCLINHIHFTKKLKSNLQFSNAFFKNIDLTIVIPPPEFS